MKALTGPWIFVREYGGSATRVAAFHLNQGELSGVQTGNVQDFTHDAPLIRAVRNAQPIFIGGNERHLSLCTPGRANVSRNAIEPLELILWGVILALVFCAAMVAVVKLYTLPRGRWR